MEITSILPDDVLEEILMRLSVKHLLRLKCVCKYWYAFIRDYGFHKKHYDFQYATCVAEHDDVPLFLDEIGSFYDEPSSSQDRWVRTQFYLLSKHQGADVVLNLTPDLDRDILPAFANVPLPRDRDVRCIGIMNGVIGLQWGEVAFSWESTRLALWNPGTREFKGIPRWPIDLEDEATRVINARNRARILGLGFDQQCADFKILGLDYTYRHSDKSSIYECMLYSLKSNSWKRIEEAPGCLLLQIHYTKIDAQLKNDVYYWVATEYGHGFKESRDVIISFNFNTEVFKQFELLEGLGCPHYESAQIFDNDDIQLQPCCHHELKIGKYKERLALFVSGAPGARVKVEMWVVTKFRDDDCEVPLSWQLGLTVGPLQSFNLLFLSTVRVCGDLLLIIRRRDEEEPIEGCLYNSSARTYNFLGVRFLSSFSYVESLFSISRFD